MGDFNNSLWPHHLWLYCRVSPHSEQPGLIFWFVSITTYSCLSMAPPCYVKCVNSSSSPQLIPTLGFSHGLSNHQHPPAICQPHSPPLPKANSSQSPAWQPAGELLPITQPSSSCRELSSTTQKPSSAVPWEFVPPWKSQLSPSSCCWPGGVPAALSLLWVQPCECPHSVWLSHIPV